MAFFASLSSPSGWAKLTLTTVQTKGNCPHNNAVVTEQTMVLVQ